LGKPPASFGIGAKRGRTIDHGQHGSRAAEQKCLHDVISKQGGMWWTFLADCAVASLDPRQKERSAID
jgi:hypothetical protein